ncbi:MAG TPA: hypothetical protein VNZ49_14155 [Bacteroidia bacterium]|jgi:hypothetical protein|nr:hypothetical protein [Bacteroidia bacterium]
MRFSKIFLALISLIIISCGQTYPNKQIDEENIKGEIYESTEIGWSIEIPKNWSIISKDKIEANDQKGKDAIEKATGQEIDTKAMKHLISFQKNQFNIFSSTIEPFKEEFPGEYEKNNKILNELVYQTFVDQGIKTDSSSGKEIIQGLEFNTFYTTVYAPDGKVILNQILYSRLINGYDFGVNINYNNEQDKKIMMDTWKKSKFLKK